MTYTEIQNFLESLRLQTVGHDRGLTSTEADTLDAVLCIQIGAPAWEHDRSVLTGFHRTVTWNHQGCRIQRLENRFLAYTGTTHAKRAVFAKRPRRDADAAAERRQMGFCSF